MLTRHPRIVALRAQFRCTLRHRHFPHLYPCRRCYCPLLFPSSRWCHWARNNRRLNRRYHLSSCSPVPLSSTRVRLVRPPTRANLPGHSGCCEPPYTYTIATENWRQRLARFSHLPEHHVGVDNIGHFLPRMGAFRSSVVHFFVCSRQWRFSDLFLPIACCTQCGQCFWARHTGFRS